MDITHIPNLKIPTEITITGENFFATPTVKLGDTPLTNVLWLDEHTLTATIPANLAPGRYDLWVTNPGGQSSALAQAILVGHQLFVPVITR